MLDDFTEISYTADEAVEDGVMMKLADGLYINTETAIRLVPRLDDQPIDLLRLRWVLSPILRMCMAGIFADKSATEYPEECDRHLAIYLIEEATGAKNPIWFEGGVFFFPEYR